MRLLLMLVCSFSVLAAQQPPVAEGLRVIIVDGDEAANIVAQRMAAEPVIEVRDRDDRRVPGAVVRFLIRRTARDRIAALFRSGQPEVRTLTDAVGRARASGLTPLEPGSFEIEVQVSHQGQTATTTIHHTNYATVAEARADGRQPSQGSASNAAAQGAAAGAGGGGMSGLAIAGLVAGGVAGAGGAYYYYEQNRKESAPPGRVAAVTASVPGGLQAATEFTFSAEAVDFDLGSLSYQWEFGDGATSSEPTPTHVYQSAGTYTVVVTVSDARQSARSETPVTVHSLTGTWVTATNAGFLALTQSGSSITGQVAHNVFPQFSPCPVVGSVSQGSPAILVVRPPCAHENPGFVAQSYPVEFRLDLSADGRTLTGSWVYVNGSTGSGEHFRQ